MSRSEMGGTVPVLVIQFGPDGGMSPLNMDPADELKVLTILSALQASVTVTRRPGHTLIHVEAPQQQEAAVDREARRRIVAEKLATLEGTE